MKTVPVWVFWHPTSRSTLPDGLEYSTVSKFQHQTEEEWKKEAWSVVLTFELPPSRQGSPSKGKLRFLVEEAPSEWLEANRKLQLFEESRKTADVWIVD